ncbi:family 43 glycosylhydrolase [Maribellus sediminis]|uniref:family 43 glycosylhydrolase n=1 Tax=Maribellus sediminis TaxID=2696285 RepID=UPI001430F942|nr:family 43 glycosylhydrolase [Maribellus sediminis]
MTFRIDTKLFIPSLFFFFITFSALGQKWPGGIHDPSSIVKCDDTYWVFGTGDGIYSMYSSDLITWQAGPTPFTKTVYPDWIKSYVGGFGGNFWAPDIIFMNDRYYLYYSCSEWGTMTSTIGCVTNKTLNPDDPDFAWVDQGFLGIWSYQPGLALNAIDPSLMRGPDGKIWMVYGSFNEEGIVVTEIDSVSGKPKSYDGNLPGKSIANSWTGPQSYVYGEGEGASMIYRDGYYYLFYNKGGCCAGIASTYFMVMGRSSNPRGPFLDKTGKALKINGQASGGTIVLKHDDSRGTEDRYFGPGHFGMYSENGVDYVTFHYYDPNGFYPNPDANNQGGPTLGLAKLVWGEDGWPSISLDFVDEGVYTIRNEFSDKVIDISSHDIAEGAKLYQYTSDSVFDTQKWVFNAMGSGEYSINNYADPGMYVEAGSTSLAVTGEYDGSVNQLFRTVTSPNGKTIIYPSTKDVVWGLPSATSSDVNLYLRSVISHDLLRWNMIPFEETLSISESRLTIEHSAGTNSSILVESNGLWSAKVFYDSWMSVETSGVQNDTLKLIYDENPTAADRRNRIYVVTNGGKSETIVVTQMGKPSSVNDPNANETVLIYPNPTSDEVTIECEENALISVLTQTGQKISNFETTRGVNKIDISSYKGGVYFFVIQTDHESFVKKILKN